MVGIPPTSNRKGRMDTMNTATGELSLSHWSFDSAHSGTAVAGDEPRPS